LRIHPDQLEDLGSEVLGFDDGSHLDEGKWSFSGHPFHVAVLSLDRLDDPGDDLEDRGRKLKGKLSQPVGLAEGVGWSPNRNPSTRRGDEDRGEAEEEECGGPEGFS
jgi:hypothetical protein